MDVGFEIRGPVHEPYLKVHRQHVLAMTLCAGSMEVGLRRSTLRRMTFDAGLMGLCPAQFGQWIGTCDMTHITMTVSDEALMSAHDGVEGRLELRPQADLVDPRLRALATAVDVERTAGFPSGRLFLDSIEQALARALVVGYAVSDRAAWVHRGGLSPRRLRKVKEFVYAKIEDDFTLHEMAESAELSTAHFSRMFRQSTGESPHRFVLRHRIERARQMLRIAETRVLDVAVACGFKSQQHFARVFRRICGVSPTEYRQEVLR